MSDLAKAFVSHLKRLADPSTGNTGAIAALRRSLAFEPGTYAHSFPFVESFVSKEGWPRKALYLVAGLFAEHQEHQPNRTFAQVLAELKQEKDRESLEQRFLALLDADEDQIAYRMRQNVRLVADRPFNWEALTKDLMSWFHPDRFVQVRWAREYYGGLADEKPQQEEEA
ncbi:type I-E CRISPR-associated protein Cse2/CasB [Deinococcota bacterium DY0809b]